MLRRKDEKEGKHEVIYQAKNAEKTRANNGTR